MFYRRYTGVLLYRDKGVGSQRYDRQTGFFTEQRPAGSGSQAMERVLGVKVPR